MLNNLSSYLSSNEYRISVLPTGVHVLNYKSVIDITSEVVIINVNNKISKIKGKDMKAVKLDKNELLITGTILGVTIDEKWSTSKN